MLILIALWLLNPPTFASNEVLSFSIQRPFGAGSSFGTNITQMVCVKKNAPCSVKKIFQGRVTESRTLDYPNAQKIASELSKHLHSNSASEKANDSRWVLVYHGKTYQGALKKTRDGKSGNLLAVMKAEARMIGESKLESRSK